MTSDRGINVSGDYLVVPLSTITLQLCVIIMCLTRYSTVEHTCNIQGQCYLLYNVSRVMYNVMLPRRDPWEWTPSAPV